MKISISRIKFKKGDVDKNEYKKEDINIKEHYRERIRIPFVIQDWKNKCQEKGLNLPDECRKIFRNGATHQDVAGSTTVHAAHVAGFGIKIGEIQKLKNFEVIKEIISIVAKTNPSTPESNQKIEKHVDDAILEVICKNWRNTDKSLESLKKEVCCFVIIEMQGKRNKHYQDWLEICNMVENCDYIDFSEQRRPGKLIFKKQDRVF